MGSPDGGPPREGGPPGAGYNRSPEKAALLVDAGGRAASRSPTPLVTPMWSADGAGLTRGVRRAGRRGRGVRQRERGHARHRLLQHPPRRHHPACRAGRDQGLRLVDAPVSGGEAGRSTRRCRSWSAARREIEAAKPYLDVVGKTSYMSAPAELPNRQGGQPAHRRREHRGARRGGRLPRGVRRGHRGRSRGARRGLAGSKVLDQKKQNMLDRAFEPGFRIALHHKDLGIVTAAAREAGVVIPLGAIVAQLMASALANGDGGLDHSGLLRGVERLSGRSQS